MIIFNQNHSRYDEPSLYMDNLIYIISYMITILIYIVNYATQGPFNPLMHEEYLKIGEYATLATSF